MKWKQLYLLPICLFLLVCVYFLPIKVNAYNMKGWNISNTLVYNIDSNNYIYPNGYMSSVVKARWGLDNQTFQSGEYYQINTSILTKQKAKTSQLRNCTINVNGAYIDAVNYYTKVWSECGEGYCDSQYNITSYFNGENLSNVPVFVQCDLYTDAEFGSISYNYSIAHEPQNNNNDSAIISAIANNGQQIVDTNNYNANQNNANRDSNTTREIENANRNHEELMGELEGQHALASDYVESTKVCKWEETSTYLIKNELANQQKCTPQASGVLQNCTGYAASELIEVKEDIYTLTNGNTGSSEYVYIIAYNENKIAIRSTFKSLKFTSSYGRTYTYDLRNTGAKYIRLSLYSSNMNIDGLFKRCGNGNQAQYEEQEKQTGLLGQIKDGINNTYNTLVGTITNVIQGIGETISNMFNWLTSTNVDTSRLNTLLNNLRDSSPPIFNILTSLKNYVQSFNPNTTCQPVSIPMNTKIANHNIEIPCGTTLFWNRQDLSTFKNWWNIFIGGLLIYIVGLKLIKVIDGAFDPQKDEVGKGLEV